MREVLEHIIFWGATILLWYGFTTLTGWGNPLMTLANFIICATWMGGFGLLRDFIEGRK